ncbi:hypothetical protein ACFW2E_28425, partial [Streptomyces sp. NPDC058964]
MRRVDRRTDTVREAHVTGPSSRSYVTWGGPTGPVKRTAATALRLPPTAAKPGLDSLVRGDFDGDGHHGLAGLADNGAGARQGGPGQVAARAT